MWEHPVVDFRLTKMNTFLYNNNFVVIKPKIHYWEQKKRPTQSETFFLFSSDYKSLSNTSHQM
jgi:hypothetical protein